MTRDTARIGLSYGRRSRFPGPVLTMTARRKHRTRRPVHRALPAREARERPCTPPTNGPGRARSPAGSGRAGGVARGFAARFLGSLVGRVLYEWVQDLLGLGS